jgi:eukaryotic-like serine/threonine-protein kinase
MNDLQSDSKAIFLDALECNSADELKRLLGLACGSDTDLRTNVEKLLRAHRDAGAFLGGAGRIDATSHQPIALPPGTHIGPYLLREQIGEGGMGLVFVADQEHPVRRRVALKVVKPGMDTRQVLARFEAERQALALMDHPNIAKVLDGGMTGEPGRVSAGSTGEPCRVSAGSTRGADATPLAGRPYFVMELVRGVPITDYCDQARLTARQRLELFLPVCRAIQHAHQKGVIHRDIKPSNLLVTLYDSHPVPKVIDFGIAKAVGTAFADHSVYTGFAQLVGTPMYMSPEQAEMTAQDVDTRADVYALGVVLYELLTGTTPFDGETLRQAGFDEMRRIIREDEPAKPSHRVTTMSAEKQSTVSGQRGVDGRQLGRQLQGGLDWVVMTCLEKDRTRRYESAGALAADIERYLRDEPVTACPPSTSYRLRTFARRNRRALATVGVIAAALIAATAVSVWQAVKARDDRDLARTSQRETVDAERRATTEAAIARAVNDFLLGDMLGQFDSVPQFSDEFGEDSDLTVVEAIDRAAARIGERFQDQPLVEAAIRTVIGRGYIFLARHQLALAHFQRALTLRQAHIGPDHPDTLASMGDLVGAYTGVGRHSDAIALGQQILQYRTATLGPNHPETFAAIGVLGAAYRTAGQWATSIPLLEKLLEEKRTVCGPTHASTLRTMHELAMNYWDVDRFDESTALHEKALDALKITTGPDYMGWIRTFAMVCQRAGKLDQADRLWREAIELNQKREDSVGTRIQRAGFLSFLSLNLLLQERYDEAEPLIRQSLVTLKKRQKGIIRTFYWMTIHGAVLSGQRRYAEAEPLLLNGYEGMKQREAIASGYELRQLVEAGERIVRFYDLTNQPEKARDWREKLSPMK